MKLQEQIEHRGIVTEIGQDEVKVSILQMSACAKCGVKNVCDMSEKTEKLVNIKSADCKDYRTGETVNVFYKETLGFRALFLGYLLPFLIVLISLIVVMSITGREGLSGLISLGLLAPYYTILYLSRNQLKKTFAFSLEKIKAV